MNSRFVVFFLWLALSPMFAVAQVVSINTGEHADFTRVAINVSPGTDWRFGRTEAGYSVSLADAPLFDLRRFFDIIPRSRIQDATSELGSGRLDLIVDCECHARVELWRPNWLLIDIVDGPPARDSIFEAWLDIPPSQPPDLPVIETVATEEPDLDLPIVVSDAGPSVASNIQLPSDTALAEEASRQAQLSDLEMMILNSLQRAADQNLIELSDPADDGDLGLAAPIEAEIQDTSSPSPGITAQTSIDAVQALRTGIRPTETAANICFRPDAFDVASWGDDRSFGEQIGERRAAVTGEFDRTDPVAVEKLAKSYLYFGFGAEAVQALSIDGIKSDERVILTSIAQLLDSSTISDPRLAAQLSCDGPAALWGLLAAEPNSFFERERVEPIVLTFKGLPSHLQVQLGPRLALRLQAVGASDLVDIALGRAEEIPEEAPDLALTTSEIAQDQGDVAAAILQLETLLLTDAEPAPEAVVRLIDLKIGAGQQIAPLELEVLDAMLFERRRTADATDLAIAKIEALRHSELFIPALEAVREWENAISSVSQRMLADSVMSDAVKQADDGAFLDLAYRTEVEAIEPDTQNAIASRLVSLGFAERALEVVIGQAVGETMSERRYIRATSEMQLGNARLAAAHLSGMTDARSREILETGIDPLGWRSDDGEPVTEDVQANSVTETSSSPLFADDNAVAPDADGQLANGRALIAESAALRDSVSSLIVDLNEAEP